MENERIPKMILNKYISVWIWSILFGATTGLLMSFITIDYFRDRWYALGIIFIFFILLGSILILLAGLNLYKYFKRFIIPTFLLKKESVDIEKYSKNLINAFLFIILSTVVRIIVSIINLAFITLGF